MSDQIQHPTFGMVGLSRNQARGVTLVGSTLPHDNFISLTIHTAKLSDDLQHNFYSDKQLIQVWLSPIQFSEMLTNMNRGDGVPCTIASHNGKSMGDAPPMNSKQALIHEDFKGICKEIAAKVNAAMEVAAEIKHVGVRKQVLHELEMLAQEIRSDLPYLEQQFTSATQQTINDAKGAIEAAMTHAIAIAGRKALQAESQALLSESTEAPKE